MTANELLLQQVALSVAILAAIGLYLEAIDLRLERDQANLHQGKGQYWFDRYNALRNEVEASRRDDGEAWRKIEPELAKIDAQRIADRQRREYRAVHGSYIGVILAADSDNEAIEGLWEITRP